jgi:hypothetical protein
MQVASTRGASAVSYLNGKRIFCDQDVSSILR